MRIYIGRQEAVTAEEFEELARGSGEFRELPAEILDRVFREEAPEDFRDLFFGPPGETDEQRRAREEAAGHILAELLDAGRDDELERLNAMYAAQLVCAANLRKRARGPRMHWVRKAA
ncbi:hypothetical protein [Streptomyces sp. NPDC058045]|uniref:hypothetical protein n=1 Tax=Streptomyces sp. NPDC058045 TaxID=3346311 RepID=UPI0036E8C60D